MKNRKILNCFKEKLEPKMKNFEIIFKDFKNGDFGELLQIEFNSTKIGGNIDLWSKGWLGIFLWDFENDEEIMNILNEPNEEKSKEANLNSLESIILKNL